MEHYVTLFDSLFLPQGLALHASMERHAGNYKLWILCVDDTVFDQLSQLNLENVALLKLSSLEDEKLLQAKKTRAKGEYCWTLTPFAPKFVFDCDKSIEQVTYIDADMWFFASPTPIFREFSEAGKGVLITEHAYAPEHDQSENSGRFCVQFMTFHRHKGEEVRQWWQNKCLEWCFARFEDGKFGDQKYLDLWPHLFDQHVHILKSKEFMLAPWNATRYPYSEGLLWHFHELRIFRDWCGVLKVNFGPYRIPQPTLDAIYTKYLFDIKCAIRTIIKNNFPIKAQKKYSVRSKILISLKLALRLRWFLQINRTARI
ncbi:hypothetical protein NH8B_3557 [Pseudogulbenkiania sp. NH8B]|uniref:hypothetical protein n=1 Tax=Pseudogulbenkiania sp. (strain NH8B) TaxID=748280 RepID=UPI000227A603|nr:hypothetical protein [Pseudogulbenkiania sp. NH8B]BAK78308.1 hypothetical protein NH8B_3557 [Pseudogulbenkiania sp. NH8B]